MNEIRFSSKPVDDLMEVWEEGIRSVARNRRLKEFRCCKCNKLLGMVNGEADIKCTKCKTLNEYTSDEREKQIEHLIKAVELITGEKLDWLYKY